MDRAESRIMTPWGSLSILGTGLLLQMLSFPLLFVIFSSLQDYPLWQMIMFVPILIWFFLPLLGVFGIIVGVKCYLRNIGTFLPVLGIIVNALWLVALGIACFYIFVLRITV
jgi:hypothetical protein